ncbi:MAG: hypothetical protein ACQCN6_07615 [Candidatus Bathyarchaeia archaeon]
MNLENEETLIMANNLLGSRNRVSLTSKRLVFEEGNGYLLIFWKQYHQLLLEDIEEASVDKDSFIVDSIKIKLKNGANMRVQFKLPDSETLYPDPELDEFCSIAERWAHAINRQVGKYVLIA